MRVANVLNSATASWTLL